jgi:hypothetical protein
LHAQAVNGVWTCTPVFQKAPDGCKHCCIGPRNIIAPLLHVVSGTNIYKNFGEHKRDLLPAFGEDGGSCSDCGIKSLYDIEQHIIRQIAEPIKLITFFFLYLQTNESELISYSIQDDMFIDMFPEIFATFHQQLLLCLFFICTRAQNKRSRAQATHQHG